ncbi:solute carrier family 35 member G1-like [Apostichopus japonicus]|uniref:solute carrier family 35 member G1-like n=1 Tax=Stichopus japonicus TaxID=307972 RepID=UPI003AB17D57
MTLIDESFDNPVYSSDAERQDNEDGRQDETKIEAPIEEATTEATVEVSSHEEKELKIQSDVDLERAAHNVGFVGTLRKTTKVTRDRRGLLIAALAAFFYSAKSMFIDVLTITVDPFQAVVMVMPMMFIVSFSVLAIKRIPPPKTVRQYVWLFLGGCAVSSYLSTFSFSLSYLEVADSVTILYASLIFVGVVSWIILKEKLLIIDFIFALISFAGVIFISRPHFIFGNKKDDTTEDQTKLLIGVGFALAAAFSVSMSFTIFRKHSQLGIQTFMSVFCSAVVGTITNALICTALGRWQSPSLQEWLLATAAGFCYISAQGSLFISLSMETATFVNIVMTIEIVFAFIWQFWFLSVSPSWTSYVGATLVIIACVGITIKKKTSDNQH